MLTVAVDTGPLYGPRTGVGRAVSGILEEFARRITDVDVIPYVVSRRAQLPPETRRLPFPAFLAMNCWSHIDFPRADRYLEPAQIVHGMNYVVPPVRVPRVVSVYDTWALRHPTSSSTAVNRAMAVLRRNITAGAVVHTSSRATANEMSEIFPRAMVRVVHLGSPSSPIIVDENADDGLRPHPELSDAKPYVFAVGTVERRKNYPRLIEAFAATRAARSGLDLVIAGSHGDDIDPVRDVTARLDPAMRSRVHLLGRVSDRDLDGLYRNATMVAYPSLDEGFGFPILEAMSHGVPVMGSNRGSIPEIAGDAAVLVDPLDTSALSSAIDRVVFDEILREQLVRKGSERCSRFTWADTADGLIDLYGSLAPEARKWL